MSAQQNRDPGLQPERTLLSWQRTLILVVVVGLLYLRGPLVPGDSAIPAPPLTVRLSVMAALLFLGTALGLHLWSRWRGTANGMHDPSRGGPPLTVARPWAMAALCAAVLGLSVLLVLTVLLSG